MSDRRIFVIGATGAQGLPVCHSLIKDGAYSLRVLTRNINSERARQLAELGDVEFVEGSFANEENLRKGYAGCWGAFVNIDGFNTGEKTETYWTIRAYELAIESGIQFFVFGNLDYGYKKSGYNPEYRCGHYDGKGRMAEWMLGQRKGHNMGTAIFTTGPYMEMSLSTFTPMTPRIVDGVVTWAVPLGDGAVPHVSLDDCGHYVRWLFDHPEKSDGLDLEVAIDHIAYKDLAQAFQKVTGKPAQYINIPASTYFEHFPFPSDQPSAYNADPNDPATMTLEQNFSGFWTMWRNSGGNKGVIRRDYQLLDEIHPKRIKTAEEFFRREEEKRRSLGLSSLYEDIESGNLKPILKLGEDKRQGIL
ncbi:related to nitrogen metabolic regulation protein nmr [Fusarium torulosum]|uniref:Related to nitrogen metabolic regulation protein nmr n=1 Tax=Fusarium torulosum TaxID=33205 RepID=A0AAE8M8R9_9HYPO|nr:related to nitrogen metabolic regulation protein nmr [Fusarium torulosum]